MLIAFLVLIIIVIGILYLVVVSENKQLRNVINTAVSDLEQVKTKSDVKKVRKYLLYA